MFALDHKRELSGRWEWMLASGIIDLVLAAIIIAGLPGTAAWAIGLLIGINMVFGGSALIAMALHAREIDPRPADSCCYRSPDCLGHLAAQQKRTEPLGVGHANMARSRCWGVSLTC